MEAPGSATEQLAWLFATGQIDLEPAPHLTQAPAPLPALAWDRVEGMLLGLAIGDALGNTAEGMAPDTRARLFGEIRDYLPNDWAGGRPVGLPSDDTQLAFWTLEHLLAHGRLDPEALAERFCMGRILGIGRTVREFIRQYQDEGRPWYQAGPRSSGNGALMRIAPVLVPHLRAPSPALWADAARAAMLTHNDRASTAACVALIDLLWRCLALKAPPAPEWWVDTVVATLRPLEGNTCYRSRVPNDAFEGPLWRFLEERVRPAVREGRSVRAACDTWYSGAYLLETLPSVLIVLARHGHDPEAALIRAVNDTWDNDTIGAIVGAVVGALHGRDALPARWRAGLLGRTTATDDGRVFELIAEARHRFGFPPDGTDLTSTTGSAPA